jgi:rhamnosyltransferase
MNLSLHESSLPTAANTAAVIVSYYPDDSFQKRLAALVLQFAAVYWVDNTPGAAVDRQADAGNRVHHLPQGENIGLASALNLGCDAALDAAYTWVVTFDQDSDLVVDFLERHLACWRRLDEPSFILGCNYFDGEDSEQPRFVQDAYVRVCSTVISSGCLMCLPAWNALGKFCDGYFIDGVDHEICLRARSRGLVVARHGEVLMQHRIGESSAGSSLLPYVHSPLRKYYSTRNGVRNIVRYMFTEPLWVVRKVVSICWELFSVMLLESNKKAKLKAMLRGVVDGVGEKSGVASEEFSG